MSANQSSSKWRERLASPLTWHFVGFAVLARARHRAVHPAGARLGRDGQPLSDVLAGKQIELRALEIQTAPLRGLDQARGKDARGRCWRSTRSAFRPTTPRSRAASANWQVASGVRLSRVQYTQGAPGSDLTEISMDAGISGEYPAIMRFINSMERDQTFFIIRAMSLTGQQGGLVNLRLRVSTWLRPADAAQRPAVHSGRLNRILQPSAAGKEGE